MLTHAVKVTQECENEYTPGLLGHGACVSYVPWFVAQSPPEFGSVKKAIEACNRLGFQAWRPEVSELRFVRTKGNRKIVVWGKAQREEVRRSIFGAYWFVSFDVADRNWGKILINEHVSRIICRRGDNGTMHPLQLPLGFVETIQALGRPSDGVLPNSILEKIKKVEWGKVGSVEDDGEPERLKKYTAGRIMDGAFAGFAGTVDLDMGDRIFVMAQIFGRESRVELDKSAFEVSR